MTAIIEAAYWISAMSQATQNRKKSFSSFTYKEAFKYLGITDLKRWTIEAEPVPVSDFFHQRLERLQRFDLESLEVSKTLLIDAICEEGLEESQRLKVWKGAYLEGEDVCGHADYLMAEWRAYLELPYVCMIEAKKDNFEQGAAQCLVELSHIKTYVPKGRDTTGALLLVDGGTWAPED